MEVLYKEYENKLPGKIINDLKAEAEKRSLNKSQTEKVLDYLVEQYDAAKINPGEAIGIITAESFGEPGTQMSIQKNEKIIVKINKKIKIIEIGRFVDSLINAKGSFKLNDSEILPLNDIEIYAPSLNNEEKVEWKRVIECSRHHTEKGLIEILTKSGRKITCTDNHSFVTRINNNVVPIKGSELNIGDRIPAINKLLPEQDIIYSVEIADHMTIPQESISIVNNQLMRLGTVAKKISSRLELDWLSGWFVGAYLAEGFSNSGMLSISNVNDTYIENAKNFVERVGLDYKDVFNTRGFALGRDLRVNSSLLANFMSSNCGSCADDKKVPEFAFSAPDNFIASLLRGYFDGDANFHVSRKMIRASSNSKNLIDGIALLLSRFKIFSYKVKDNKGQHWLLIPYKYAPQFLQFIGSDIEYKRKDLEILAEQAKRFWNNKSQDYTDMISGFDNILVDISKKLGLMTRYVNSSTKRQKIGRTALFRHMQKFKIIAEQKNINIEEELKILERMFNSDVIWDEIVKMENIPYKGYVYDLSVPGLETFTTAEGIVTHNTLNVFHFAGVAEVSVTQGLPRLIEILDARKSIKTPSMEIRIKKEHGKDTEEIRRIAAQIKETCLQEICEEFNINLTKMQLDVKINKSKMREIKAKIEEVLERINEAHKNIKAKETEEGFSVKLEETENELMEIYKLKEKLKETYIKGVKGVAHVLPVKDGNEFMIITAGSNLADVIKIPEIDGSRTTTNDIHEVAKVLGVEAARQTIINEAEKVIEDQGLDVDIRHILCVADAMCRTGFVKGITRSGITGEKKSVLARASFETPIHHLVNASLVGEKDDLNSVIENVMLNQPVPLGTGLPDLIAKMGSSATIKKAVSENKEEVKQ